MAALPDVEQRAPEELEAAKELLVSELRHVRAHVSSKKSFLCPIPKAHQINKEPITTPQLHTVDLADMHADASCRGRRRSQDRRGSFQSNKNMDISRHLVANTAPRIVQPNLTELNPFRDCSASMQFAVANSDSRMSGGCFHNLGALLSCIDD